MAGYRVEAKNYFVTTQRGDDRNVDRASLLRIGTKLARSVALCGLAVQFPQLALADTTTINGPVTGTQGPTLPPINGSDTLIITTSASITANTNNSPGVLATNGSNNISNYGRIVTTGNAVTAGSAASGIQTTGGLTTIINHGTIETTGTSVSGGDTSGINALDGSNTVVNYGTINTFGLRNARGIRISGGNSTIINYGTVTTRNSAAISAQDGNNNITNLGTVTALGEGAAAISAGGGANTVTNSGTIISYSGNSITFTGAGNSLILGKSSFLAGNIGLGAGTQIELATGPSYSKLIGYTGTLTGVKTTGEVPVFVNTTTKQLATYDSTVFAASSDALGDMTSTISSLTPNRNGDILAEHPLWIQGFRMTSSYSGTSSTLSRQYLFSGVGIGYDIVRSQEHKLGLLCGYGKSTLTANSGMVQSFDNTSDGGFLGFYGQTRSGSISLDYAVYGGVQSFQQQRYVNDNLTLLGNSSTNSSYQGWWIAPELGVTVKAGEVNGWSILPAARIRYAQQRMGSYTESGGGSANATVNGRNVSIGQGFVGIGTRKNVKTTLGNNTRMVLEGQVGYIYRGTVGTNTVDVTLIGQSLSLPPESVNRNAFAVTAGVTLDLSSTVALKIRGDAAAGSGINYVGGGWAGVNIKF